ncbi:MAG: PepSY domain-containing protein [Candidatus Polarisedimenticolaceae bacterium]|nr:PepSY domain-containing protein [Candidatus Polarisedimenticolaceae bacterium]
MTNLSRSTGILLTAALLLSGLIHNVQAGDEIGHQQARALVAAGKILPLQQILNQIEPLGRLLEVELEFEKGDYIYEIERVDSQGRVWELEFNASSGQLIKQQEER